MAGARFEVGFKSVEDPEGIPLIDGRRVAFDATGSDKVEFMVAPNPGEGLKSLVKIASGGETSRLMLAMKNVLAQADSIPTLVFDEIDQGIGGTGGHDCRAKTLEPGQTAPGFLCYPPSTTGCIRRSAFQGVEISR